MDQGSRFGKGLGVLMILMQEEQRVLKIATSNPDNPVPYHTYHTYLN